MTKNQRGESQEFALKLLNAESEAEVSAIIDEIESAWDIHWEPHGTEQNYSLVYSNTPDPVPSFAELITNSIDAVLEKKYKQVHGYSYDSSTGIITAEDAADQLFQDEINEEIEVIADGKTGTYPNLIVRDTGAGQPPEHFEERFLALGAGSQFKDEWPFMQGRFKMGSGAVLPHSGEKGYKLILSAGFEEEENWSWSIIRDNPEDGQFEYFRLADGIPTFGGQIKGQKIGTIVKVYEYDWGSTMNILVQSSLRQRLDRVIVDPVIPYKLSETRPKSATVDELTTNGMFGRFEHWNVKPVIRLDEVFEWDFGEPFGMREVRVVVFKDKITIEENDDLSKRQKREFVAGERHREQAVLYLVNGQTHAHERARFLTGSRNCRLPHVGEDMLVFMDLSDFADKESHDRRDFLELFTTSRDRMGSTELAEQLQEELVEGITNFSPVVEENERRRKRLTRKKQKDKEFDILENILERNSGIRRFFNTGEFLRVSGGEIDIEEDYEADFFPSELKIIKRKRQYGSIDLWDESKGLFTKRQPVNRNGQVQFKLDAPNDYFHRDEKPGELIIHGADISSRTLYNGILTVRLTPIDDASEGEKTRVHVEVTRDPKESLTTEFEVEYTEKVESEPSEQSSSSDGRSDALEEPNTIPVYKEGGEDVVTWDDMSPRWTEEDIVDIHRGDDELDLWINMDAGPVHHFVARHDLSKMGKETVEEVWRVGILLYSISQLVSLREQTEDNDELLPPEEIIPITMKGIAQSLLDQHIPDEEMALDNLLVQ